MPDPPCFVRKHEASPAKSSRVGTLARTSRGGAQRDNSEMGTGGPKELKIEWSKNIPLISVKTIFTNNILCFFTRVVDMIEKLYSKEIAMSENDA